MRGAIFNSLARSGDRVAHGSARLLNGPDGHVLVGVVRSIQTVAHDTWLRISRRSERVKKKRL